MFKNTRLSATLAAVLFSVTAASALVSAPAFADAPASAAASAPAAASIATASSTNTLSTTPRGQSAQPIPVGDGPVLWLLTCLILLLGGRRARARL